MIKGIKHIIFDLGGVLLNIDYQLTEQAFIDLGVSDFPKMYSQLKQTSLFDDYETGKISEDEFVEQLLQVTGVKISKADVVDAWNAMLLDFPTRRLQILQQLRTYYDMVLLSNTNETHEVAFNKILMDSHTIPNIAAFFDRVYLSHRIGMRKPDVEVFQRIINECSFKPEHTLFIDDSPQHIKGAEQLGIQTIWLEKGMTIERDVFKPI